MSNAPHDPDLPRPAPTPPVAAQSAALRDDSDFIQP